MMNRIACEAQPGVTLELLSVNRYPLVPGDQICWQCYNRADGLISPETCVAFAIVPPGTVPAGDPWLVIPVPEPSGMLMLLCGLAALAVMGRGSDDRSAAAELVPGPGVPLGRG